MSIIRALCLLLAGAMVVGGQEPNPAPPKSNVKPSDLCSVTGVVVKSTTGEGIKRVMVQLIPLGGGQQAYSTFTESNGYFIMRDITPGRYAINASGNGYRQQASGKGKGNTQVGILDLAPGKNVSGIAFRLLPPGVITGTVYDEDGEPVTSAQVQALRVSGSGTHRQIGGASSQQTNDLGEYRIWGLEAGQYLVAATYQRPQTNPGQQMDEVYLPTFHPSTADTSQATVVEVQPGAEVSGIDVDLRQAHTVMVRGRVMVDGPVKSLRGVYVSLAPRVAAEGGYSLSNFGAPVQSDSGDFEIRGVPPGPYDLSAMWNDGKRQLYGRVPVEVGNANLDGVTFVLGSPISLVGRFRVEGSDPFDFTRLGLWLQPIDSTRGGGSSQLKADGTFVVENVYDGNYRLRILGFPVPYYVKSAREGGSDVLESGLTISRSQPPSRLEIVLSPDGGRVDGTVSKEHNPVSGALVVLVPDPPHRDREEMYGMTTTDAFGRFSLLGLPPGDFKLFAWELVQGKNYTDPDFFKAFEDRGTPVHIGEGQQQVQLEVITSEEEVR
ncbi:MAG: carboxypeptidase-like regulatory domain-containing protein [Terriglobia bacterium]